MSTPFNSRTAIGRIYGFRNYILMKITIVVLWFGTVVIAGLSRDYYGDGRIENSLSKRMSWFVNRTNITDSVSKDQQRIMNEHDERQANNLQPRNKAADAHRKLIIGGHNAERGMFPFFAQFEQYGGGVLIAPDIVLTAGHCNPPMNQHVKVHVNRYSIYDPLTLDDDFEIEGIVQYPNWTQIDGRPDMINDFNIFVLNGCSQQPTVRLNRDPSIPHAGDTVTVIGMGSTKPQPELFFSSLPDTLQQVDVEVISSEQCETSHDNNRGLSYQGRILDEQMICTMGVYDGGIQKDACAFDSGSPLLVKRKRHRNMNPIDERHSHKDDNEDEDHDDEDGVKRKSSKQADARFRRARDVDDDFVPEIRSRKRSDIRQVRNYHVATTENHRMKRNRRKQAERRQLLTTNAVATTEDKDDEYLVVGLVSWGEGCADPDFPAVNARISYAWEWIADTVCEYSKADSAILRNEFSCGTRMRHKISSNKAVQESKSDKLKPVTPMQANHSKEPQISAPEDDQKLHDSGSENLVPISHDGASNRQDLVPEQQQENKGKGTSEIVAVESGSGQHTHSLAQHNKYKHAPLRLFLLIIGYIMFAVGILFATLAFCCEGVFEEGKATKRRENYEIIP